MTKMTDSQTFWAGVPRDIACVAVIGAGAMGGGIAAQFANAGVKVILLDMPGGDGAAPDAPAQAGLARQVRIQGFTGTSGPARVVTGNTSDDLHLLAEADWIVEAIVERLDIKRALYARIDAIRKPGSIVSSNTSTLLHSQLIAGMSDAFRREFLISHFFNPPRLMPLLEIVSTPETDPALLARAQRGAAQVLGKTVINCRDTPGFVANRIGCFWMAAAALLARQHGLTVEEADAVHQAMGIPKTGVFGLFDLIGIDLVPQVWRSLVDGLPETDRFRRYDIAADPMFQTLVAQGRFGRKSGGGFFRKGEKGIEASDLGDQGWRPTRAVAARDLPGGGKDPGALLSDPGRYGEYARAVLSEVVAYAAEHGPDIAADPADLDAGMQLGYAWRQGPFTLADRWGLDRVVAHLESQAIPVPPLLAQAAANGGFYDKGRFLTGAAASDGGATPLTAAALRAQGAPILGNQAATLLDAGDGIGLLEIHTKMNAISPEVLDVIEQVLPLLGTRLQGLVIGNDDPRAFSAGADLGFILSLIQGGNADQFSHFVERGQKLYLGLRYAPVPVVAAVHGFVLGGGCELALHADRIVAHAETRFGLPEVLVGLIPAWGGCTSLLARGLQQGLSPEDAAMRAARIIFGAAQSGSAEQALETGILSPSDRLVMNRDLLLTEARALVLQMIRQGYTPPNCLDVTSVDGLDLSTLAADGSDYDRQVLAGLSRVLGGSDTRTDAGNMAVEHRVLFDLVARPETQARMEHMLRTGKPLRN
ncbi:3-hydroxyacyl-CoA dehydrogenase NAD-binding domain-containing protein [Paracoccus sp. DMF-8]|uniref:3-hydroxyacyl-CoA dehydrogenase/enoyl-CoA hydratase family protein n=1 Tax=Paracoccus sp. DMF-8 TaxID=3019445 RepID=UPI0023E3CCD0|nr:3-hydroxyacyl-CoA dehydrogenase/enoyl-CoA hydratase family protein [Paracoccus sp. DMF-8]MDF3608054.1 3-hydroxyacyl-CoA dehydrogenase NAD-binding domain-containing protein [Paracoccus sp. DMF-8]